mgnify:CR=1 FL=1
MELVAVIALFVSGALHAAGEYLSKVWGFDPGWRMGLAAVAAYALSSAAWLPALLYRNQLSTIGIAWEIIAISTTLFLGVVIFRESLTAGQWAGITLGLVALWLLVR